MSSRMNALTSRFQTGNRSVNRNNSAQSPDSAVKDDSDAEKENGDQSDRDGPGKKGDDNDKDEEKNDEKPAPVGFFHPSLAHVRKEAVTKWIITTTILMAFVLAVLSLYWGALFQIPQHLHKLTVFVVDFDGQTAPYNTSGITPIIGPTITALAQKTVQEGKPNLGYQILGASDFNYDPIQVRQAIFNWEAWAGIIINPNATSMLYSAAQNGNTSYDPMGACELVFISSRDDTSWYDYIYPLISAFQTQATSQAGEQWAKTILQNAASNTTLAQNLARVPQALSPGIGFSMFDLRPFYPYQAVPAESIGLIYLIIISFFSFSFYLPIHFKYLKPEGHPPLKFYQLVLWRWCATMSAYFMLSLAYSLVSLAFQINFSGGNPVSSETQVTWTIDGYSNPDAYGHATFVIYWLLNFFGMIALGLACENVAMFVGQPWMGLWLIFWVITNVATSFYDITLEPGFFHWGYAWPLHSVVQGSRQLLFGLNSHIGLDFGILIAWGAVNTAIFPFACYFMRWKSKHGVNEYYR